jgi:dipeptidyl aminopeptidase/acylaminoacyl peptidase
VDVERVLSTPAKTSADVRDLTAKFDEDPDLIEWGPDGIYFAAQQKTTGHLFRLDPQSAKITRFTEPDAYYFAGASFSKDFKTVAIAADDSTHMIELFVSPTDKFARLLISAQTPQETGHRRSRQLETRMAPASKAFCASPPTTILPKNILCWS